MPSKKKNETSEPTPGGQTVQSLYQLQAVKLPLVLEGSGTTGTPIDRYSVVAYRHTDEHKVPVAGISIPHAFVSQLLALLCQSTSFMDGEYSFDIQFKATTPTLEERMKNNHD